MSDLNIKLRINLSKPITRNWKNTHNSVKKTKTPSVQHSKICSNIIATNPISRCSAKRHAPPFLIQRPKAVTNASDRTVKSSMPLDCHTAIGKRKILKMTSTVKRPRSLLQAIRQKISLCSLRPMRSSIRMDNCSWMWTSPIRETSSVCYRLFLRIRRRTSRHGMQQSPNSEKPCRNSAKS